jgi:CheY-like chemotaxis protein
VQHALIVDDSKTASYALRQMLQRLHFQVDTTDSAEAALDYLKECRPQLIFMDHMMPGMDGFDAVKVIKADPATAEIPIVMYTAKEGDVYVGQARALGAADILTKPATDEELQQVLQRLKHHQQSAKPALIPNIIAAEPVDRDSPAAAFSGIENRPTVIVPRTASAQTLTVRYPADTSRSGFLPLMLMITMLGVLALFVLGYQERQEFQAQRAKFAETLAWSFSQAGHYAWNEIPFNDRRLEQLQSLVGHLRELNFRGTLTLESHVGDFCIVTQRRADGRMSRQLAPADMVVNDCGEIGWDEYRALELAGQQSPAFRSYVTKMKNDPDITIQLVPLGSVRPLKAYPASGGSSSAGAWNAVAASNQVVTFSLSPQP